MYSIVYGTEYRILARLLTAHTKLRYNVHTGYIYKPSLYSARTPTEGIQGKNGKIAMIYLVFICGFTRA